MALPNIKPKLSWPRIPAQAQLSIFTTNIYLHLKLKLLPLVASTQSWRIQPIWRAMLLSHLVHPRIFNETVLLPGVASERLKTLYPQNPINRLMDL
jgi:hypothetical protein